MNDLCKALLAALFMLAGFHVSAQSAPPATTAPAVAPSVKVDNIHYFPFTVNVSALTVTLHIQDARITQYYTPLFQKYHYMGSVQTWEDMIEEYMAVKDLDFSIRNKISSESDNDQLLWTASSRQELDYFLKLVQPTFATLSKLEEFVQTVDPKHIYDGSHRGEEY